MGRRRTQAVLGVLLWGLGGFPLGCGRDPGDTRLNAEIAKLRRDLRALDETLAAARARPLIGPKDVMVGVHQQAVLALLEAVLPAEGTLPGGEVGIRVEHAAVRFDGGLGTVDLDGSAWLAKHPRVRAQVHVSGGFAEARIDPESHQLVFRLALDTLEARPVPGGPLAWLLRGSLLRVLDDTGRDAFTRLLPPLRVPLKLEQPVELPDLDQDWLHVRGGRLGLTVAFTGMFANDGRLWVGLRPTLGRWRRNGAPE